MSTENFIKALSQLSFENTFNPYTDRCERYDICDAPEKRCNLLRQMLIAASKVKLDSIWIGRDLGYRGGRRTGLALTDDVHLSHHASRWGIDIDPITRGHITHGKIIVEKTAAIVWRILTEISVPIFLWNVFPLHPHEASNPFSNRMHNTQEKIAGLRLLAMLVDFLKPNRIIAIGNDAEQAALQLKTHCPVYKVRHPSYGGQNIFLTKIQSLYSIRS